MSGGSLGRRVPPDRSPPGRVSLDRARLSRVRRFFARVVVSVAWSEVVLDRPLLRGLRQDPVEKWRRLAVEFRALAVEMGGVLIKLGQFLSTRVDVLPLEVCRELRGLQDEVPPAPWPEIRRAIEDDLGRSVDEVFAQLDPEPMGAASLAQAHAGRLAGGEPIVVKVLRPGIEVLVETDLVAVASLISWLRFWRWVRQRIDLEWLREEFETTTRRELDLRAEGEHAERFAAMFEDEPRVLVPTVHWEASGPRVLAQQNVAAVRMSDPDAIAAAGVDRSELARTLYRVTMEQIFVHAFVHADPHPGNLFVHPLPDGEFRVAYVDFGMVAEIPQRLRSALRRYVVGIGSRDATEVVAALRESGSLLPGADLGRLEEAVETVFDRFWGIEMGRLGKVARSEMAGLWRELGELILETPIQVQVDLMFTGRALELLSGLCTSLDPEFNVWVETAPFAERFMLRDGWAEAAAEAGAQVRALTRLPARADRILQRAERGRLTFRTSLAPDHRRELRRLTGGLDRVAEAVVGGALVVAGALVADLHLAAGATVGAVGVAFWMFGALRRWVRRG